jgi:hypothetical protein
MSRNNFLGGVSATGGTGTLQVAAGGGLALPAQGLVGGQLVEYIIRQETSSTDRTMVQGETGWGSMSAANVLTRLKPIVTCVAGVIDDSSPSPLNFATSNVFVEVGPISEGGPTSYPARANFAGTYTYGPNEWLIGSNLADGADYGTIPLTANSQFMVPMRLEMGFALSAMGVSVNTGGGAGKLLSCAVATMNPLNGVPGVIVQAVNGLDISGTGVKSGTPTTARLSASGWYWGIMTSDGTPTILGSNSQSPNPIGGFGSFSTRVCRFVTRARTYGIYTVGTDAMAGTSASPTGVINQAAPIILMR